MEQELIENDIKNNRLKQVTQKKDDFFGKFQGKFKSIISNDKNDESKGVGVFDKMAGKFNQLIKQDSKDQKPKQ